MPHPPFTAAAERNSSDRTSDSPDVVSCIDVSIISQLAQASGDPPAVVAQNLAVCGGRLCWSPRYAVARANRSGLFRGRLRWIVSPPNEPLCVTAIAVLAETGDEWRCSVALDAALDDGRIAAGLAEDEARDGLHWLAAAHLVELYAPDLLLALPVGEKRVPVPIANVDCAPVSRVVFDEHGAADPRRPTSAESLLARVEHHIKRAEHPLRVLDLNASALLDAAALLDDGVHRVAALWRLCTDHLAEGDAQ